MVAFILALDGLHVWRAPELLIGRPKEWIRAGRDVATPLRDQIVIIGIDEASVTALGPWGPEWRRWHTALVRRLAVARPRAIGFDVYFPSPHAYDGVFAAALQEARAQGVRVVLARAYEPRTRSFMPTSPVLERAASGVASAYLPKDVVTNLVRYLPLHMEWPADGTAEAARLVPALALALAAPEEATLAALRERDQGRLPIRFAGGTGSFWTVPYHRVVNGEIPLEAFGGKFILIGSLLAAHKDFYDVPGESQMPGVEIQANALYTLLGGPVRAAPWLLQAALVLLLAEATFLLCRRYRSRARAVLLIALAFGFVLVGLHLTRGDPPVDLAVVPGILAVLATWVTYAAVEKRQVRQALQAGLGLPDFALRRLERDMAGGPLQKRVTVLASDVVGYSVVSHASNPEQLQAMMGAYARRMEEIIYRYGGYINKYIGDAILAIFGYPLDEEETAWRGVQAACAMQEALVVLQAEWRARGLPGLAGTRIGVHTGQVTLGYFGGTKQQLDVLGDNVDLAARLEQAAGQTSGRVLVSLETYAELRDRARGSRVPVVLKNRPDVNEAVAIEGVGSTLPPTGEATGERRAV
ncbi:MAG: adenylate/guanylate cyclase domain-containing protein [Deltaproteobacteria bacterium]|nr:adenylate/guanylate cyclase domain-containing protein [Deltaproteobacteria bacterium]